MSKPIDEQSVSTTTDAVEYDHHNDYEILIRYIRDKVDQLLSVMGTLPLRAEELDDSALLSIDPIGIIADAFQQILQHNEKTNENLQLVNDEIGAILDTVGAAIIMVDADLSIKVHNRQSDELFIKECMPVSGSKLCDCLRGGCEYIELTVFESAINEGIKQRKNNIIIGERYYDLIITPLKNNEKQVVSLIMAFFDTTERKQTEEKLRLGAAVFEHALEGVLVTDSNNTIVAVNDAFLNITGYDSDELIGKNPKVLQSGMHGKDFYKEFWRSIKSRGYWKGEVWDRKKSGEVFPALQTISVIKRDDGSISNYISIMSDITKLKESQDRLDYLAFHDPLTGLPNRILFNDRLTQSIEKSKRDSTKLAVLFIDLDRFKNINDTLGHAVGDKILEEVAQRLSSNVRKIDTVARLGGDEFILILEGVEHSEDVGYFVNKLFRVFKHPFYVENHELHLSSSIGISMYPADGENVETLVKNADAAMYRAKDQGRNGFCFFTEELSKNAFEKLTLEANLRKAISLDQFSLYYQPQYLIESGELVSAEALIRWNHPEMGNIPPDRFIPLAEETGLILQIGEWVVYESCRQLREWRSTDYDLGHVAINVSSLQIQRGDIINNILDATSLYKLQLSDIAIEVTESVIMENTDEAITVLRDLKDLGVTIAIDDFGTGYSSLGYLKRLPVDILKIDRNFIKDVDENTEDYAIAKAILSLAEILQLDVIAEGVEKESHLVFLKRHECKLAQGYYFSYPLPAEKFETLLKTQP